MAMRHRITPALRNRFAGSRNGVLVVSGSNKRNARRRLEAEVMRHAETELNRFNAQQARKQSGPRP